MTALSTVTDRLVDLLPRMSSVSQVVDDAVRLRQYPSAGLVDNLAGIARELEGLSHDLTSAGNDVLGRRLGNDAISLARKSGVMHGMNEHRNTFASSWHGSLAQPIADVRDAIKQLT